MDAAASGIGSGPVWKRLGVFQAVALSDLTPLFRGRSIRPSNKLKEMVVWVVKIDAATTIQLIDLAAS
jgi:hypothetical protein